MKTIIKYLFSVIALLATGLPVFATVNVQVNADGSRVTRVLINGSTNAKFDIVFVGDGFTSSAADQTKFNNAVNDAIHAMQNKHPYMENMCGFNIWRVNVISAQSGIDHPIDGIAKNTELNCTFGDDMSQPRRAIYSTTPAKVMEAANFAPAHDAVYVLVNDDEYGGFSSDIVYTSLEASMPEVIVHELGHFVGHLADEYTCRFCDGRFEPPYSGPELDAINVTIQTNPSLIKWKKFITPGTPLPTTVNSPAGVVGLWQGGNYSPTGVFRPQQNCLMQSLNLELCTVCNNGLSHILNKYCTICDKEPTSLACALSRFREKLYITKKAIFPIPLCCFCPLDLGFNTVIDLTVNPELFDIQVLNDNNIIVDASVSSNGNGGTAISFQEQKNTSYFLKMTSRTGSDKVTIINAKLSRDGQQSVLF